MRADYSFLEPLKPPPDAVTPLKVGIVATPDFTFLSLGCFVDCLRLAADERDFSRKIYCAWELLSHDDAPIISSCGFPVLPTRQFGDPTEYDYIVVHGGIVQTQRPFPPELYDYIRQAVRADVPVIGLCTGTFVLAELGLLDGRRCAVQFSMEAAFKQVHPKVITVTDVPVVTDGGFITCPGGLAAINLATHLVAEHCGRSRADKVLHYVLSNRGLDQMQALRDDSGNALRCLDARVVNAVGLMRQRLFETCTIAVLASQVGATERELTRLFKKHLRATPADYWRRLRLKAAHWMVLNSSRSITQIAYECGFTDSSHMIHWFKREFDVTPARLRETHVQLGML
ncbi:HTH-type transcriptional regulator CdhR [Pseudomonas reidholzensis]|uniref:HTH-type transcriptional regulator CdhR n=1 Tax=Pseudomonas reidholzensis TaxID=1785162 RepID=A0A383RQ17_9PSED|nr:GlxA family transcriptional regulator [Pseudomonas reidholzensis]SYX88985.1 HTH-type transcriptional regulator CdhR [Pseudomonas reidholzensis]